jgi:hypothetical protein
MSKVFLKGCRFHPGRMSEGVVKHSATPTAGPQKLRIGGFPFAGE